MGWNYDISQAPSGTIKQVVGKTPKGEYVEKTVFVPEKIIACADDGKTVTPTYWMPKEHRWHFFANGEAPLAWMPWPTHPEAD